jgi:hypothetical protein
LILTDSRSSPPEPPERLIEITMAEKEEKIVKEKEVEEDAPHAAFRAVMEAYKKQNPAKWEVKRAAMEAKYKKKLAFGLTEGKPDGSIIVVGE